MEYSCWLARRRRVEGLADRVRPPYLQWVKSFACKTRVAVMCYVGPAGRDAAVAAGAAARAAVAERAAAAHDGFAAIAAAAAPVPELELEREEESAGAARAAALRAFALAVLALATFHQTMIVQVVLASAYPVACAQVYCACASSSRASFAIRRSAAP